MGRFKIIKNIILLTGISFCITLLSLLYSVYADYESLKSNTEARLLTLDSALLADIKKRDYPKLRSLLYLAWDDRFEGIGLITYQSPKDIIHIGKIYPVGAQPDTILTHSVRDYNYGDDVAMIKVFCEWHTVAFATVRRNAPLIIALNVLVVVLTFFAQLPHLFYTKKLTMLLKFLSFYDGSEQMRMNLIKDLKKSNDESIREIVTGIATVIERERELSAQEYENRRLVDIGRSTAMVAHDVRKPLASLKGLLQALPAIKDDPVRLAQMTASVDQSIALVNAMLSEITDFSKDSTSLVLDEHNPQGIIIAAIGDALRNHPHCKIDINYTLNHLHTMKVDSTRVIRLLTNIIDNALDAMKGEDGQAVGELWIRTEERPADMVIVITISDSGPGIPEDVLPKIFDPFFTHGKKSGTGLGLAICRRVVEMHGGRLEARNRSHVQNGGVAARECESVKGADFIIELPLGSDSVDINESELIHHSAEMNVFRREEASRIEGGDTANTAEFMRINRERGRVSHLLVVDDEPLFRNMIDHLLDGLGGIKECVKLIGIDNAEMVLDFFEVGTFDYLITDIDLGRGRMGGYEFAREVLKNYPNTYVLIHSNKRKEEMDRKIRVVAGEKFMGFLPKPMTSSQLLQFLACRSFEASSQVLDSQACKPANLKTVLLLNDDEDFNFGMKLHYKGSEIQILDATNVSDALKFLTERKVDAIISDINLGEGMPDGYEFLKTIRQRGKQTPFYFASGYSRVDVWPRAEPLGATGYLQMPFDEKDLRKTLGLD